MANPERDLPPERVLLIDASPYIFRSYFALPSSISTPAGAPANAANGFASFLVKLLTEEQPDHVAVAFDGSLTTSFRNQIYPNYKANRDLPAKELVAQLDFCRRIAAALGLATDISDDFEADDLIGSWLHEVDWGTPQPPAKLHTSIVSSDKDLGQLVTDSVDLYDFAKGLHLGKAEIQSKFGVPPSQLVDFLALAGDSVDNIPGVPGIGAKTAAALLASFAGVDDLLGQIDQVAHLPLRGAAGIASKLTTHQESARLSWQLALIVQDAPVNRDRKHYAWRGPTDDWTPLCEELGFNSLLERGLALRTVAPQA